MKKVIYFLGFIGFIFLSACKNDVCEGITCLNGGTCVNGDCVCEEGYEGPSCAELSIPKRITLTSVEITDIPLFNSSGEAWDLFDAPDFYVSIVHGAENTFSEILFNEASDEVFFSLNWTVEYDEFENVHLALYDWDEFSSDDLILSGQSIGSLNIQKPVAEGSLPGGGYIKMNFEYEF